MSTRQILPAKADVTLLDELLAVTAACQVASAPEMDALYPRIGGILLENIRRLDIDEDMDQLMCFARSMACEMLSSEVRTKHFGASCWLPDPREHCPPYALKVNGRNNAASEVREETRQKVAMVHLFASHLMRDPALASCAQAIFAHEDKHGLWTKEDFVDRE
jgi:hypothetical protein